MSARMRISAVRRAVYSALDCSTIAEPLCSLIFIFSTAHPVKFCLFPFLFSPSQFFSLAIFHPSSNRLTLKYFIQNVLQYKDNKFSTFNFTDCCAQQRTYEKFYGLMAQRLCQINKTYVEPFQVNTQQLLLFKKFKFVFLRGGEWS